MRNLVRWLGVWMLLLSAPGCASFGSGKGGSAGKGTGPQPRLSASASGVTASPSERSSLSPSGPGERAPYRLRVGDPVVIYLRGILPKDDEIQDVVDERGCVTMPYLDNVYATGKTVSELERDIQRMYIEHQIYKSVTVSVVMPSQSFFVQGEVRQPQRFQIITGMTVMQAIATAGGYTEFADPKRVTLTRGGKVRVLNMREIERDPQKDVGVESGDVIRVPRSIF